ncbi:MAG: class I SAM-dependent methyltransferase [Gammaproteobacteria bacterium]|nr:class I SAM-dependent methyltransferase [Gammaproteobacteria bacterium]NND36661.1 class I SAM-dependent methyltransferase [Gammaproteobacteria bacterium]
MLDALLACPRCDNPLSTTDDGFACKGCKVDFPTIGKVPFLFADPAAALGEWKSRLHMELQRLDQEACKLAAALEQENLRDATRERLELLNAATRDHANRLLALLAPLELADLSGAIETYLALRTRLPTDQGLHTYYPNIHRDWSWGERENDAAAELVGDMLDQPLGKMLVLGAGPGRLAYDLHQRLAPQLTIALDFNPLFTILTRRLVDGETIELYEFPIAPIALEDQARLRNLRADRPVGPNFACVTADASRPPFRQKSFDTIVTPWVTDILPEDLETQAARINQLLRDDGQWLNFGSVAFQNTDPAKRYGLEEVVAIIQEQGFAHPRVDETRIPYMCSPASRHGRRERVVTIAARKTSKAKKASRHESLPDWLVRGDSPVPMTDAFRMQAMSTRIHAFVMSMIDGKRSIQDMAKLMEEQQLMTRDEAIPVIRSFLIRMFDDSARQ